MRGEAIALRLVPTEGSDTPVLSNCLAVSHLPGLVCVDFGFLDPARLAAPATESPRRLDGRLAVRVAVTYDAAAALHQRLGRLLNDLRKAANPPPAAK
jgi:hypothetical protein